MSLLLVFKEGSGSGIRHRLKPGTDLCIGRSHENGIRLSEGDVSGKHLRVMTNVAGTTVAEVLSSHRTFCNGKRLERGTRLELHPGDEVRLGASVSFEVGEETSAPDGETGGLFSEAGSESTDRISASSISRLRTMKEETDAPTETLEATRTVAQELTQGDGETVGDAESIDTDGFLRDDDDETDSGPVSQPSEGETAEMRTMAGDEEDVLRKKREFDIRRRNRMFMWAIPVMLTFAAVIAAYVVLKPVPEEYTSWPRDESGAFLNKYELVEPFLAVCVPDVPAFSATKTETGKRIVSALGRDRDIPLTILAERLRDPAELTRDHDASMDAYLSRRREKDNMFSVGANRIRKFLCVNSGAGVPSTYVDYTRRKGVEEYFGYLVFLRKADTAYAFSIEVPLAAQWRSEKFLLAHLESFILYAARRAPEHWEGGTWYRRGTPASKDLDEARSYLVRSKSPMDWEKGFYYLKSALIKGTGSGDETLVNEAVDILSKLRGKQSDWYNTSKLAYLEASAAGDKERMNSLQAMCESVFTAAFQDSDYRYERIKRKDWR